MQGCYSLQTSKHRSPDETIRQNLLNELRIRFLQSFHFVRQVNRQVVAELGTGLIAQEPDLVIDGEHIVWRVPIVLSLPELGDLGQVGTIDITAETGEVLTTAATRERIIQHARRLYAGATL